MKEDVVAANLANLRQSISELKECLSSTYKCNFLGADNKQ